MDWQSKNHLPPDFLGVASKVYAQDPFWIPEVASDLERAFGPHNRYFQSNFAWVDLEPGQSRIAGFMNPAQRINGRRSAFFGYWETVDDLDVNRRLFADFERWAKNRGAEEVYGPINFSTFGNYRLRLDHFDRPSFQGEPHNPRYYPRLMTELGYKECLIYRSTIAVDPVLFHQRNDENLKDFHSRNEETFRVETLTPEYWSKNAETFYQLSSSIFSENFAYSGISQDEFKQAVVLPFASRFCTQSSIVVFDKENQVAGVFLIFPDYHPLICQGAPTRRRLSEVSYREHFPLLKAPLALFKTGGVMPQHRRSRIFTLMSFEAAARMKAYSSFGAVLVRAGNPSGIVAERVCGGPTSEYRQYALYAKSL